MEHVTLAHLRSHWLRRTFDVFLLLLFFIFSIPQANSATAESLGADEDILKTTFGGSRNHFGSSATLLKFFDVFGKVEVSAGAITAPWYRTHSG